MDQDLPGGNEIRTPTETAIDQRDNKTGGTNPGTTSTETKRRGRPPGTTKQTEEKLSGLADVAAPKAIEIEVPGTAESDPPKKKPGRPAGTSKKPQASKSAKVDSTQLQLLLLTLSGLVASRPGMEVWNLTAEESKTIAEPLANIMAKNQAISNAMGEHADAFALLAACFMVFLPKAIMYAATKPKKPKQGDKVTYGNQPTTQPPNQKTTPGRNIEPNAGQRTHAPKNNHQNLGGQLFELIPANGGF